MILKDTRFFTKIDLRFLSWGLGRICNMRLKVVYMERETKLTVHEKVNQSITQQFRKWSRSLVLVAVVLYTALVLLLRHTAPGLETDAEPPSTTFNAAQQRDGAKEVVFFIIVCEETPRKNQGGSAASDITRQLRQAYVMFKSAAALTSTKLRFLVVADSKHLYHRVTSLTSGWPQEYQKRVAFEWQPVWYPSDRQDMRSMFRVCATERLFLTEIFSELDAAIYIDTDLVFLRPPEELWQVFEKFNGEQVAAMAPCLYHYGTSKNMVPYYGKTGLNAGVMHMNLTRMKSFPGGGWIAANMQVFDTYKTKIKLADQDILNILFHKHPNLLYELGCEWNYRIFQCSNGQNMCPAASNGVSILHGNAMAFVSGREMKLQVVYEAWEKHQLGEPLSHLLDQLMKELQAVSSQGLPSKCAQIPHIDDILTKEFQKHV